MMIEWRRRVAFTIEVFPEGYNPAPMLDAGDQQRQQVAVEAVCMRPSRIGMPTLAPRGQTGRRHRAGDTIALGQIAAKPQQGFAVRHRLHPLGNRPAPKGGGQPQYSF